MQTAILQAQAAETAAAGHAAAAEVVNATTQAQASANSAAASATSAANAATSETNAATSATNAETTFNNFQAIYPGSASSDPSVDGNGDTLTTGDLYHNSTSGNMMYYTGSAWTAIS